MENESFYFNERNYVVQKESIYFLISTIISVVLYLILICTIVGLIYGLVLILVSWFTQGITLAYVKQNCIKISPNQLKTIDDKITDFANKMQLPKKPEIYMLQSNGILNSFATRFMGKDYVVLYADVLELAFEQGEDAVNFIIAHEMAHVKRKHITKMKWTFGSLIIFPLYYAYSRACETTCDNIAAALAPNNSAEGLLTLLAGKKLYKNVNVQDFITTSEKEYGFFAWMSEIWSTHPHLSQRIKNIITNTSMQNKNSYVLNNIN